MKLRVEASGDRDVVMTRTFQAPRALVWDCHTKPELVRRWLLGPPGWTMPVCEIDLRVGGRYRYVWRNMDGRDMGMGGTYRELDAPVRSVSTELFDEDWTGGETLVTMTLEEHDGVTQLEMIVRYGTSEARAGALKSGMTDGMEMGYVRLDELLADPATL
jgi:uncharacterized protein YndB with AHSA1/START domain